MKTPYLIMDIFMLKSVDLQG